MNDHILNIARLEELQKLIHKEMVVIELLEVLDFNFQWLIRFCDKNDIEIPDRVRLYESLNKVRLLIDELAPTNLQQPKRTTEDATE